MFHFNLKLIKWLAVSVLKMAELWRKKYINHSAVTSVIN